MLGTVKIGGGGSTVAMTIGRGKAIRGQKLVVVTVVENLNAAANNRTSQDVTLSGSVSPKSIIQQRSASKLNEKVSFVTVVTFT